MGKNYFDPQKRAFVEKFSTYRSREFIVDHEASRMNPLKKAFWFQTVYNRLLRFSKLENWRVGRGDRFAVFMTRLLDGIVDKETFLDLGCGQGDITRFLLNELRKRNPLMRGIGIDDKTEILRKKWKDDLAFWWGDVLHNELPDASADVIFVGYLLQVLDEKKREELFREILRLLAPGGTVIFLEVIELGKEQDAKNARKHQALNPHTSYLVKERGEWRAYINDHSLLVTDEEDVDDRSVAFKARKA